MMLLEDISEIVVFLGPFLLLLFVFGVRAMLRTRTYPSLLVLSCLGIFTLLAMFLTGAFRTGETARACLFIYPYLLLPVAVCLHRAGGASQQRKRLLAVVFAQSVAMQTLGGYFW
ncbi:MAG: hypothetical protein A2V70_19090 [Planctomycetes bacterium RBG_13_63_9]|nr:MAG: hypothetical protein A2V70_19090 [Planctomycetes bacterium RBG_13_63_9]